MSKMRRRSSGPPERSLTQIDEALSATVKPPAAGLWRVGRLPDPVDVPPTPAPIVNADVPLLETNRWDDAQGQFSTLYCGTTPEACFAETLAPFRPTDVVSRINAFMTEEADEGTDFDLVSGTVPADYIHHRALAHFTVPVHRNFIDIDDAKTHAALNASIPHVPRDYGLQGFDRGVAMTQDRRITRRIARHYYDLSQAHDHHAFCGIRYESRLDAQYECWALFVPPLPFDTAEADVTHLTWSNEHLRAAAERLSLTLPA